MRKPKKKPEWPDPARNDGGPSLGQTVQDMLNISLDISTPETTSTPDVPSTPDFGGFDGGSSGGGGGGSEY